MPSKSPIDALLHIRDSIYKARRFSKGLTYEMFLDDDLVFYAVVRCLEIISEASRRLPPEMIARHSDIPWREMAGAGNVFRHDCEDVQHRLVWGTLQDRFPSLLTAVEDELTRYGGEDGSS